MDISSKKSPIEKRIIKDFEGVQDADQGTLKAIVNCFWAIWMMHLR